MSRHPYPRATLAVVFFLSGLAGLGYQVVWGRWLHSVFGASAWALAAVLSAFMAGLALGSLSAGRLGPRLKMDPLMAYGVIEILIGAWALLFPHLLDVVVTVQGELFFRWVEHHTLYGLIRFGLCFLVLLVPTSLMGATFPLLSTYVGRHSDAPTRWVSLLYGLNTAGAVAGTLLSGFLLLPRFGLTGSNHLLVVVNIGVGLAAILRARADTRLAAQPRSTKRAPTASRRQEASPSAVPGPARSGIYALILGLFFANGIFNLAYEVLWGRALALIIGTTTYALSLMLGVVLAGIAVGSLWMTGRLERQKDPLGSLLRIQALMALWVLASPLLVNQLPYIFLRGLWVLGIGWASSLTLKCVLAALLLLPLTLGMGAVFPLGIQLAFRRPEGIGREIGDLYGLNTAGGILARSRRDSW